MSEKYNKRNASQVDFSSKPTLWRKLHPQIKVIISFMNALYKTYKVSLIKESFQEKLGELLVSLSYYPANNTLTLGVLKVRLGTFPHLEINWEKCSSLWYFIPLSNHC